MRPEQFEAAVKRTRLHARGRAAAWAVLVEGHKQGVVARMLGLQRPTVNAYCRAVKDVLRAEVPTPASWEVVSVRVPKRIATEIRRMARTARREYAAQALEAKAAREKVAEGIGVLHAPAGGAEAP